MSEATTMVVFCIRIYTCVSKTGVFVVACYSHRSEGNKYGNFKLWCSFRMIIQCAVPNTIKIGVASLQSGFRHHSLTMSYILGYLKEFSN